MKAAAFAVALSLVLLSTAALADVPRLINYQGTLTDENGVALDTTVSMTFSIYTDSLGGTQVWTETQSAVEVNNGIFDVLLGRANAIPDTVFDNPSCWLGVQVGGDPEIQPRQRIASVGYAFQAAEADTADFARLAPAVSDGDWTISGNDMYSAVSGNVGIGTASPTAKLHIGGTPGVDGIKFPDGTLQTSAPTGDITAVYADNGLTGGATSGDAHLNVGAGDGIDLAADAVSVDVTDFAGNGLGESSNDLQVNTGTGLQISGDAVGLTSAYSSGSAYDSRFVNEGQSNSITAAMIVTDGVGSSEIAANAVGSSEIASNAVGTSEIATDGVGNDELQANITVTNLDADDIDVTTGSYNAITAYTSGGSSYPAVWCEHQNGGSGVYGTTSATSYAGVRGHNTASTGTGIIASGNNQSGTYLTGGSGMSGAGSAYGLFGKCKNTSGQRAGGYFSCEGGPYAYVALETSGGTEYKINGTGSVSSVMPTSKGRVNLIAPESPEAWIQDFGSGEMTNGVASVNLDPTFLECVTISKDQPMRVFITFTSPPPDAYYVEKDANGFEVIATSGELSNATFDYFVSARWKGWENVRFDPAVPRPEEMEIGLIEQSQMEIEPAERSQEQLGGAR